MVGIEIKFNSFQVKIQTSKFNSRKKKRHFRKKMQSDKNATKQKFGERAFFTDKRIKIFFN